MELHEIINAYINQYVYQSYLEIGVLEGYTFDRVNLKGKTSVDPNHVSDVRLTSDQFFNELSKNTIFDLILIDGYHESNQVMRDIENSLNHLSDNGVILVHDVLPKKKKITTKEPKGEEWTGDVWKGFFAVTLYRNDIAFKILDEAKTGVGVIWKENSDDKDRLDWNDYLYIKERFFC